MGDRFHGMDANKAQCNEPYAENDDIPILPTAPTDIACLNLRIKTLREKGLTHSLKKAPGSKKDKKRKHAADFETITSAAKPSDQDKLTKKDSNGIKNSATASLTRKVLEEQEERNKKRKMEQNANVAGLFNKNEHKPNKGNSADFMTRGFSIGRK